MSLRTVTATLALAALTGCPSMFEASFDRSTVHDQFQLAQSCPSNQMTVTSTTEPDWIRVPTAAAPPPPPEVAADPARSQVYYSTHPASIDPLANAPFFMVQGCGHTTWYACPLELNLDGTSQSPYCNAVADPPAK